MAFQKPKGTQDLLPGTVEKWQFIEEKIKAVCCRYNYKELRTPIFEQTELFTRGVGETTDVVSKEMYTFLDKGDRSMTLRPEGTAGVVRAYVENKLYGEPDLTKVYYVGPMFRYEQPQAGRFRQFHQFGIEAFGSTDASLDAEVISLGFQFYKELGLSGVTVEVNSVGTPEIRAAFKSKLQDFLAPVKDKLCRDCQSRYDKNPLRLLDCKVDQAHFEGAPSILDSLDEECTNHFATVRGYLDAMGVNYTINPRLVRGLDYYTHTAFEFKAEGIGAIDTIGGGGRYNGLVADVGGPDQPGVGFGLGLERLVLVLEKQGIDIPSGKGLDMYLVALGEAAEKEITRLLFELRSQGVVAEKDYGGRKMKAQMKSADRLHAKYVAILGDDELARGEITLKSMANGEQEVLDLENFIEKFLNKQ
ncbi:histidyl-tRNA synthetase [Paenibacillus swuensis]|uniref:Histidine--tRNA ligase n=1 Tax=Paenibacillus swuensis TaxID=1178515 RepID=A0A172TJQ0_9BACL|nr:histidine--tRNA ligase [Paenibacillus swuensis]ANE47202.1 histidyl-tRNA synthetase [Paenibacillus swuensis]